MMYGFMGMITFCMAMSMRALFIPMKWKNKYVSFENFLFLGMLYITIMIGFGLLYLVLQLEGYPILQGEGVEYRSLMDMLYFSFYFSGITLFSVGYGDIVPSGAGIWIALIEAWIGYTIPAAFVMRTVIDMKAERV